MTRVAALGSAYRMRSAPPQRERQESSRRRVERDSSKTLRTAQDPAIRLRHQGTKNDLEILQLCSDGGGRGFVRAYKKASSQSKVQESSAYKISIIATILLRLDTEAAGGKKQLDTYKLSIIATSTTRRQLLLNTRAKWHLAPPSRPSPNRCCQATRRRVSTRELARSNFLQNGRFCTQPIIVSLRSSAR